MSDINALNQLANFRAGSPLASEDPVIRDQALRQLVRSLEPSKPIRRRVSDLLSVVMALSARTRRMVLPRVTVDVDVFTPGGSRAVHLFFPDDQ
ncbi:hypothetical protein [Pelagibacterium limicola]|uniref:hypothetical protein n=1 Tax=Pelagibacterium limicola TaxID=2791022 RepID=UPI0018AF8489|nr:hypothetical protein [Pelagibacterium limicola]